MAAKSSRRGVSESQSAPASRRSSDSRRAADPGLVPSERRRRSAEPAPTAHQQEVSPPTNSEASKKAEREKYRQAFARRQIYSLVKQSMHRDDGGDCSDQPLTVSPTPAGRFQEVGQAVTAGVRKVMMRMAIGGVFQAMSGQHHFRERLKNLTRSTFKSLDWSGFVRELQHQKAEMREHEDTLHHLLKQVDISADGLGIIERAQETLPASLQSLESSAEAMELDPEACFQELRRSQELVKSQTEAAEGLRGSLMVLSLLEPLEGADNSGTHKVKDHSEAKALVAGLPDGVEDTLRRLLANEPDSEASHRKCAQELQHLGATSDDIATVVDFLAEDTWRVLAEKAISGLLADLRTMSAALQSRCEDVRKRLWTEFSEELLNVNWKDDFERMISGEKRRSVGGEPQDLEPLKSLAKDLRGRTKDLADRAEEIADQGDLKQGREEASQRALHDVRSALGRAPTISKSLSKLGSRRTLDLSSLEDVDGPAASSRSTLPASGGQPVRAPFAGRATVSMPIATARVTVASVVQKGKGRPAGSASPATPRHGARPSAVASRGGAVTNFPGPELAEPPSSPGLAGSASPGTPRQAARPWSQPESQSASLPGSEPGSPRMTPKSLTTAPRGWRRSSASSAGSGASGSAGGEAGAEAEAPPERWAPYPVQEEDEDGLESGSDSGTGVAVTRTKSEPAAAAVVAAAAAAPSGQQRRHASFPDAWQVTVTASRKSEAEESHSQPEQPAPAASEGRPPAAEARAHCPAERWEALLQRHSEAADAPSGLGASLAELRDQVQARWGGAAAAGAWLAAKGGSAKVSALRAELGSAGACWSSDELCVLFRGLGLEYAEDQELNSEAFERVEMWSKWMEVQDSDLIDDLAVTLRRLQLRRVLLDGMTVPEQLLFCVHAALECGADGEQGPTTPPIAESLQACQQILKARQADKFAEAACSRRGLRVLVGTVASPALPAHLRVMAASILGQAVSKRFGSFTQRPPSRRTATQELGAGPHGGGRAGGGALAARSDRSAEEEELEAVLGTELWLPLLDILDPDKPGCSPKLGEPLHSALLRLLRQARLPTALAGPRGGDLAQQIVAGLERLRTAEPRLERLAKVVAAFKLLEESHELGHGLESGSTAAQVRALAAALGGCGALREKLSAMPASEAASEVGRRAAGLLQAWERERRRLAARWSEDVKRPPCMRNMEALSRVVSEAAADGFATEWTPVANFKAVRKSKAGAPVLRVAASPLGTASRSPRAALPAADAEAPPSVPGPPPEPPPGMTGTEREVYSRLLDFEEGTVERQVMMRLLGRTELSQLREAPPSTAEPQDTRPSTIESRATGRERKPPRVLWFVDDFLPPSTARRQAAARRGPEGSAEQPGWRAAKASFLPSLQPSPRCRAGPATARAA